VFEREGKKPQNQKKNWYNRGSVNNLEKRIGGVTKMEERKAGTLSHLV